MSSDDLVAAAQVVADMTWGRTADPGAHRARAAAIRNLRAALATKPEPGLTTEDSCPCGHLDDEHVHYCSSDDVPIGICPCDAEYVRLSAGTTEP